MDNSKIGGFIAQKRKALGLTQQKLADSLHVSFQAVSKWENGTALPDVAMLPALAAALETTVDALLGYTAQRLSKYEAAYEQNGFYWGLNPNHLCYEIMKLRPPVRPYRVLDVGCGEGKDAVFFARNGYAVTAFDIAGAGVEKARELAQRAGVQVNFFRADMADYEPEGMYDIIFSSSALEYLPTQARQRVIDRFKAHTAPNGLNVINVLVEKPFVARAKSKGGNLWRSGELFTAYHDWLLHRCAESIFDCNSGGVPHRHCMDTMIAEKYM